MVTNKLMQQQHYNLVLHYVRQHLNVQQFFCMYLFYVVYYKIMVKYRWQTKDSAAMIVQ